MTKLSQAGSSDSLKPRKHARETACKMEGQNSSAFSLFDKHSYTSVPWLLQGIPNMVARDPSTGKNSFFQNYNRIILHVKSSVHLQIHHNLFILIKLTQLKLLCSCCHNNFNVQDNEKLEEKNHQKTFTLQLLLTCCNGVLCAFCILHLATDVLDCIFEAILLCVYQKC